MMKAGPVVLSAVLAATLAACGSRTEQNQAAPEDATSAPLEVNNIASFGENVAAPGQGANEARPVEQTSPATPARPAEPQRTSPAPKAEPPSQPAQPDDPHAGHDMSAMNHQ